MHDAVHPTWPGPFPHRQHGEVQPPAAFLEALPSSDGDVWMLRLVGHTDFVMVSDPKLIEEVFTADPTVLHTGSGTGKPVMGPRSLIILNEPEHAEMRKLLKPPFRGESVERYNDLTAEHRRAGARRMAAERAAAGCCRACRGSRST